VLESIARLRPVYRKYSGVIIDMFYDHFLAGNWKEYSNKSLDEFAEEKYSVLRRHIHLLPHRSQKILEYMQMQNWLVEYQNLSGLRKALLGMSRRTTFVSRMEHAVDDLQDNYELFRNEFQRYFPELIQFVAVKYEITNRV
jgi:acyl carrier protein phosphodiesterase